MTRNTLNRMIKAAGRKRTALDRALDEAAKLGKPTSTGIAAGAGLGTILAAAGALARHGEDSSNTSILSNPLLLGALGAGAGYLGGNYLDKTPTSSSGIGNRIANLSLLGLAAGVGIPGTVMSGMDIEDKLRDAEKYYARATANLAPELKNSNGLLFNLERGRADHYLPGGSRPLTRQELDEIRTAGKEYAEALRGAGKTEEARLIANQFHANLPPAADAKLGSKFLEKLRFSKYSPVRWTQAFDPRKGGKILSQLKTMAAKNRILTGLAAAGLLSGAGGLAYKTFADKD